MSAGKYENAEFHKGKGCTNCNDTGYHGRIGIYEMIEPDKAMLEAIRNGDIAMFSEVVNENNNYVPLVESGLQLAAQGITSLNEVMSFAGEYYQQEEEAEVISSYSLEEL